MKITVYIKKDDEEENHRSFCVKPTTGDELHEANNDVASFITECFEELKEEGF